MKAVRCVIVAAFATIALSVAPSIAQAAQGFIVDQADLRAGPDEQFPSVDMLPAGAQVEVFGCLSGHTWCDVGFQQDRGWVSGQDLEVLYQSNRVKIVTIETEVVPAMTGEKSAGAITGEKTGNVAPGKANENLAKKGCKPGTPNCPKGAGNGG